MQKLGIITIFGCTPKKQYNYRKLKISQQLHNLIKSRSLVVIDLRIPNHMKLISQLLLSII
jgi:hypothetical protein